MRLPGNQRISLSFCLFVLLIAPAVAQAKGPTLRRPAGLALDEASQRLFVANRDSGSLSVIDTETLEVVAEIELGGRLIDVASINRDRLLVLDAEGELLLLVRQADTWSVAARQSLPTGPVRLLADADRSVCFVTSLWSKTVAAISLEDQSGVGSVLGEVRQVRLPFEPREMCLLRSREKLIVTDAFQKSVAVIDIERLEIDAIKETIGHNIRGLAADSDETRIMVAMQQLNGTARANRDDVHWGNMMANLLVDISIDDLCDPDRELERAGRVMYLGAPGRAAGDPGAVTTAHELRTVLYSGVNEVGIQVGNTPMQRVGVGRRPVAAVLATDGRLFVANQFSDSVSVVDTKTAVVKADVTLGTGRELTPVELGEALFFDARLSHDGWMSCHSCHTDGHSNGQVNDNLSDGSFGAAKRVLSLFGVGETGPWGWNGQVASLEQQVENSIQSTMQGNRPDATHVASMVAFLETIELPKVVQNRDDPPGRQQQIAAGKALFAELQCHRCHTPPIYTSTEVFDVGIKDEKGASTFNPPSLRGTSMRRRFFHDARASSLDDVVGRYGHQLPRELSSLETQQLIRFLESL